MLSNKMWSDQNILIEIKRQAKPFFRVLEAYTRFISSLSPVASNHLGSGIHVDLKFGIFI